MVENSDKEGIFKVAIKKKSYIQGKPHKAISWIFSRKLARQKGVALYNQNAERKKKLQPKVLYSIKLSFWLEV